MPINLKYLPQFGSSVVNNPQFKIVSRIPSLIKLNLLFIYWISSKSEIVESRVNFIYCPNLFLIYFPCFAPMVYKTRLRFILFAPHLFVQPRHACQFCERAVKNEPFAPKDNWACRNICAREARCPAPLSSLDISNGIEKSFYIICGRKRQFSSADRWATREKNTSVCVMHNSELFTGAPRFTTRRKRFLYLFVLTLVRRELAKNKRACVAAVAGRREYKINKNSQRKGVARNKNIKRKPLLFIFTKETFYIKRNCYRTHTSRALKRECWITNSRMTFFQSMKTLFFLQETNFVAQIFHF